MNPRPGPRPHPTDARRLRRWLAAGLSIGALCSLAGAAVGQGDGHSTSPAASASASASPASSASAAPSSAVSDEAQAACFESFGKAQRLRREGKLLASRSDLLVCGRAPCPGAVVDKCVRWLGEVTAAIPSIVIAATGRGGADTVEVRVLIDGGLRAERLDGRPIELDPGPHQLLLEHAGKRVEQQLLLTAGHKNRRIEVTFAEPPPPPLYPQPSAAPTADAAERPISISPLAYIGFGAATVGLVVGTVTGVMALDKAAELEEVCPKDHCASTQQEAFDEGATLAHVSTAAFIVGAAGIATGVIGLVWTLSDGEADSPSQATVRPWVGVGVGGVEGRF